MSPFPQVADAERYFSTVAITNRDIALAEYEAAAQRCNDDERAITIANGLLIAGLATMYPLLSPVLETLLGLKANGADLPLGVFIFGWFLTTSVISSYVCDLRRAYVFSARKVIVIRRLLGLSFGHFALVLPSWRLEGADQPFAIKLFPGWRPAAAYSLYATVFLSASVLWLAIMSALPHTSLSSQNPWMVSAASSALWAAYWLFSMRRKLYDTHEGLFLSAARCLAWICRVRLVADIHQTLYRAQLARTEASRLKLDFEAIKPVLIYREDRGFYKHRGIALLSTIRAGWDWVKRSPSGGASTITQQLVRSLFIVDLHKQFRRKFVEIALALWLEGLMLKPEIIEIYIASVRYDNGVTGYLAARKHFGVGRSKNITKGEAFVLVERIANVKRQFRASSVQRSLSEAIASGVLTRSDATKALDIYQALLLSKRLQADAITSPAAVKTALGL